MQCNAYRAEICQDTFEFKIETSTKMHTPFLTGLKEKRSTEGSSKLKVRKHDKLRWKWSQHQNKCKFQMGQDQVSGRVSVLCLLAASVAMFYGNLRNFVIRSKSVEMSCLLNKFVNWCNFWSNEGVTVHVYDYIPECHVTFGRGRFHNVWWDPHIDHKTSWGTISNYPWHIPIWTICAFRVLNPHQWSLAKHVV